MKINKDMILRKVGVDIILVPVGNALKNHNGFFMLSETANFLWSHLPECDTVEELAKMLFDEYEVTEEQALADTREFVDKLIELEIIDKQ